MKAVILAGGLGSRLSEETDHIPKPMVLIGGMPILWHIMKIYSHHGIDDFIVCLGYKGYLIKEYFYNYTLHTSDVTFDMRNGSMEVLQSTREPWRITLIDTGLNTDTGGRLKRIASYIGNETFCCTYGDGVGDINVTDSIAFHRKHGKLATVTTVPTPGRFGMVETDGDRAISFREKSPSADTVVNGGFFVLQPEALNYIPTDDTIWERGPLERIAADGQLMVYKHSGFWQPMDTLREKRKLQDLWDTQNAPWKVWA